MVGFMSGDDAARDEGNQTMSKINQLAVGSTVIFSKKPAGSWLTENQPYIVEAIGKAIYFRNPVTGGGTFDQARLVERSEFTVQVAA
jgi:hypothetical protein